MNRIRRKDQSIGTYEISKIILSCFDDEKKIDIMDYLLVVIDNYKNTYLNNYSEKLFCQVNCFNFQSNLYSFLSNIWLDISSLRNMKHLKRS